MGTLFEDLRDGFRDGIAFVADKTDEYTKISKLKIDMLSLKRNIEKLFAELGGRTYELLHGETTESVPEDEEVKKLVEQISELEEELDSKKEEIKSIKAEKKEHRKARDEAKSQPESKDEEEATIIEETPDKEEK